MSVKIIGYFMDAGETEIKSNNVFIALDEPSLRNRPESFTIYDGAHANGHDKAYLKECTRITVQDYLKASHWYTPSEYLN